MDHDVIIVGGGTAGCVLARRLSEDPDRTVLLLEAGPDYPSIEQTPEEILSGKLPPMSHDWGYIEAGRSTTESPVYLPRGKVIGGSSATNYAFAMRARPSDHDEWAAMGLTGWGFDDLLPLYREMETDPGGDDRWHGRDGLFRVARPGWGQVAPTARAFADASRALGFPVVEDVNAPGQPGYGIVPRNAVDGVRENLAMTYLNPVRDRPNLQVRGDTLVDRVRVDSGRATGVLLDDGEEVSGHRVVLCSGAFNSPTILLRSGIGPRAELEPLGIEVVRDSPGVGQNLMEHPVFWNIHAANPTDHEASTIFESCLSYRLRPDEPDYDLHLIPSSLMAAEDIPPQYVPPLREHPTGFDFVVFVANMRPRSRGTVRLSSTDPAAAPTIELNLYGDPWDAEIVAEGVKVARRLARQPPFDGLLAGERAPGLGVGDDELVDAVQRSVTHYNHPSGTCRMGPPGDPATVVDPEGKVMGVKGLSVVDASIIPVLPRVPINPTTVLIAEKLAATF